jgi:chromosome partitioning protein
MLGPNCHGKFEYCSGTAEKGMAHKTVSFINQKGGCGKSSCCFHLAGRLAEAGQRVLVVDADPQGSLSQAFFGSARVELTPMHETLAACFGEGNLPVSLKRLVRPTGIPRLDIIAANQTLASFNTPCPEQTGLMQFAVQELLSGATDYDYLLIDCPPNLYQCSWNALVAADFVVIPVPPEDFGAQGLRAVHQAVENARPLNSRLQLLGHLVTRFDCRLLIHQTYEQRLRALHGPLVLQTVIPEASAFKVALARRLPVTLACPETKSAHAIRMLEAELLERMNRTADLRQVA